MTGKSDLVNLCLQKVPDVNFDITKKYSSIINLLYLVILNFAYVAFEKCSPDVLP